MTLFFISALIFTVLTALIAKKNGRNIMLAAVLGFLFGLFAFIGYLFAGESEMKKEERLRRVYGPNR